MLINQDQEIYSHIYIENLCKKLAIVELDYHPNWFCINLYNEILYVHKYSNNIKSSPVSSINGVCAMTQISLEDAEIRLKKFSKLRSFE